MNNKSDKKRKHKQKQKQSKTKKKTTSRQSKKKNEIKSGGAGWFKGLFSGKTDESSKMKELRQPLLQKSQNNASSASSNPQQLVSSNLQQSASSNPQQLVSSNGSYNSKTKIPSNQQNWNNPKTLSQLQVPLLSESKRLANPQGANLKPPANPNNSQQPPPPPRPPNAQPSGTNTIISISRCSIM